MEALPIARLTIAPRRSRAVHSSVTVAMPTAQMPAKIHHRCDSEYGPARNHWTEFVTRSRTGISAIQPLRFDRDWWYAKGANRRRGKPNADDR
jgi:hypothetical protein